MYLSEQDLQEETKVRRLNIVNSISGIKPGNLVGTRSKEGIPNLAIISSVVHLSSNPPFLGFMMRPLKEVRRHTYENILETKEYTINMIHKNFIENAHYTSAKFDASESEFEKCELTESYLNGLSAPYVKESQLKIGLEYEESIPIPSSETVMIVGKIKHINLDENALNKEGYIDIEKLGGVGISGLNTYYSLEKIGTFPYARRSEIPNFG